MGYVLCFVCTVVIVTQRKFMKLRNKISAPELDNTILLWKIHLYFKILFFQNYFPFENCIQWKVICIQNSYWILWEVCIHCFFNFISLCKFQFLNKFRRTDGERGTKKANKRRFFLSKKCQCHYFWLNLNGTENEEQYQLVHRYLTKNIFEKQILDVVFARMSINSWNAVSN